MTVAVSVLVGCSTDAVAPPGTARIADSADMVLYNMETATRQDGIRRSQVVADTSYLYQNSQVMELRKLRVTFFDAAGSQTSILTADEGTYQITRESLDARGNVVVVTTDGKRLTTPHLIYDRLANQIRSDTVFTFDSPTEHLTGKSFVSDPEFTTAIVRHPRGGLLPGQ